MTLNEIAYTIAHSFDRGKDYILIERIKDLARNARILYIHREVDRNGVNQNYIQPYIVELVLVNASETTEIISNFTLLRSVNKIPATIRYASDVPFSFVGSVDRIVSFGYIKPHEFRTVQNLPLIGNAIKWFFTNGYIYIVNNTKVGPILVEDIFEILDVTQSEDPTGLLYEDDMEFPVPGDILNNIITDITNMLRLGNDPKQESVVTERDIN